jgi:phage-related minor tail protein
LFTQIGDNIATGITDALVGAIEGTRSLGEAAKAIVNDLASSLLRLGINTLLKRSFGGIFSNLPGLANGGRASAGRSYLVGERGPEIFTPKSSGTVIPNNQIGGAGGGIVNNINVNVSAEGMQSNANEDRGKELGVALASAIQSELIKQKRPGGLLAT